MILGYGLMFSVYMIFLVLPGSLSSSVSKLKNHMVGRVSTLVIQVYQLFIVDSYQNWYGDIVFMDGLCRSTELLVTSEIFVLILILAILHFQAIYYRRPELYLLILSNLLGISYLIASNDWLITVTAWELFNLSLYLITSINSESEAALSAAIKYFILSALTTTFLLLSVALLYGLTGSTHYDSLNMILPYIIESNGYFPGAPFISVSIIFVFMIAPLLFKLGAAPLHNVSVDLYDAVPTPITVYLINISKVTVLILLVTIFNFLESVSNILIFVGVLSLIVGSVGLGSQFKIKRFLTYSSISHLGFMLLTLCTLQFDAFFYYGFIYFINSIALFGVLIVLGADREISLITQLAGLFRNNWALAIIFSFGLFSLAGIPPLSGFLAKYMALKAYMYSGWFAIAIIAVLASVVSATNYLSVVKTVAFDVTRLPRVSMLAGTATQLALLFSFNLFFMFTGASLLSMFTSNLVDSSIIYAFIPAFITRKSINNEKGEDKNQPEQNSE